MGDRAYARIVVGGQLKQDLLADFVNAADGETPAQGMVFELEDHGRNGGCFEELEAFCFKNGLTYWRENGGCSGAFDDGGECWRPGMERPFQWGELAGGSDFAVTVGELQNHLDAGRSLAEVIALAKGNFFGEDDVPVLEAA